MSGGIERAFATVLAPRWSEIATVATSSTAATIDLDTVGPQVASPARSSTGARKKYVTLCAMTADCWVVFASTSADADDINDATAGVNQTTGCWPLTQGIPQSFYVPTDYAWLGYITASATGTLTIYISSDSV